MSYSPIIYKIQNTIFGWLYQVKFISDSTEPANSNASHILTLKGIRSTDIEKLQCAKALKSKLNLKESCS